MSATEQDCHFKKWLMSKSVEEQESLVIDIVQEIITAYRVAIKNGGLSQNA